MGCFVGSIDDSNITSACIVLWLTVSNDCINDIKSWEAQSLKRDDEVTIYLQLTIPSASIISTAS